MCRRCRLLFWRRKKDCKHRPPAREQPTVTEGDKALEQARETLRVANEQKAEVDKEARALRRLKTQNHFADMVQDTFFRGGHV